MTDIREEAIVAGKRAWANLRFGCRMDEIVAAVVDAATPIVAGPASREVHRLNSERVTLRAQVEALTTRGVGARVVDGELETYALVGRDEILDLLGGA